MNDSGSPFQQKTTPDFKVSMKKVKIAAVVAFLAIAALIIGAGSVFTLNSGEEAVITRWGKYLKTITSPGLQLKIPFIDSKHIVNVEMLQRILFGSKQINETDYIDVPEESTMITQEENLVKADLVIQYNVSDSYNYLFKVDDPYGTLHVIAQSSYRRVVASHSLDDILTNQKDVMQREILSDLQEICDKYELGVRIIAVQLQDTSAPDEVKDSFLDVTNAIEDKNTKINEASKYANEQLPQARGQAQSLLNEAQAYKEKRINEALGSVARYKANEAEYLNQPNVMKTRMYLEMIRTVFPKFEKIYFTDSNGQMLEFLPLASMNSN